MTGRARPPRRRIEKLTISIIPHQAQRYNTPGDWEYTSPGASRASRGAGEISIRVSALRHGRPCPENRAQSFELLLAIHELVEAWTCYHAGILSSAVDAFDQGETWRARGFDEPGDDPLAPYHEQHLRAFAIERAAAEVLGFDRAEWEAYCAALDAEDHEG